MTRTAAAACGGLAWVFIDNYAAIPPESIRRLLACTRPVFCVLWRSARIMTCSASLTER
ncbi:hypothetical protein LNP02_19090 [Klebsiella variicola subsp. variicola]|nr:hypothetical protein [Klebsiella variicola subsp. variicola]